ncbi:MAG: peptide chain release factor N(5)-glutamine methyltransferase [Bacteroidota bacterium]
MTLPAVKEYIISSLSAIYDEHEALAIANTLLSHVLSDAVHHSFDNITPSSLDPIHIEKIEQAVSRLLLHEPLQYVLEEAWFYNIPFYVNKYVLIPRPETEELVELIINSQFARHQTSFSILDIGTGSGCIPIVLKKQFPLATVLGLDVSDDALKVAQHNAQKNGAEIEFIKADILNPEQLNLQPLDIIVSNPPYITESEKGEMHANVLEHEPHLALFVTSDNPLQFYETITLFSATHLKRGGQLYFEVNTSYSKEIKSFMEENGFTEVLIVKDMQGKDRMITGSKYR